MRRSSQDKPLKTTLVWTTVVSSLLGCTSVILYTHLNRQRRPAAECR
jgi:hypothetical protein